MKALIKWTLWQRRWSSLWWSIGIFVLIFINMIFYPSFKDQAEELQKSFDNLPDTAVQLFGGSTDFFSPVGFLNSQIFFFTLPLVLGILAISLGSGILAREEQDQTIEALLSRPVSRTRLLFGKALAGVLILALVTLICLVTTLVTARLVDLELSAGSIAAATSVCGLLSLSIGAIAFLISSTGRARVASFGIAMAIALGGYIISSLAGTVDWLEWPSKILPFNYYQSESILRGTYDWSNLWFFTAVIAISGLLSWVAFRKRDIY